MTIPLRFRNLCTRYAFVLAAVFGVTVSLGQLTAVAQTNCAAVPSGLIGWWSAEGNATDFTGAHSGSFPFGSAFATGVVGQCFDFDGSLRRVNIPDDPAFQLTNAMTLEAWVYPRAYGGFITFRGDNRGGLDNWTLDTYDSGFVKFSLVDEANNVATIRAPLALNQWQHVAATWSRATGELKIYVNGALGAQTNSTLVPIGVLDAASEPAIGIGNHGGTFHQFPFNGLIDELAIYSRALASNEVTQIFQAGAAGKCAVNNLVPSPGPIVSAFSPLSARPGDLVTLTGSNFHPLAASNIVYFGATKAAVLSASSNSLQVVVPRGATHARPTVTVNGLTGAARNSFVPTFAGGASLAATNFAPRFSLGTGTGPTQTAIADFDGDGKPDLAVTDDYADSISIYQNISQAGALGASSFGPRIVLPASTADYSPYLVTAGDVDGDGKLDLVASDIVGNTVSVFRNQASPGSLSSNSFAPFVTFAVGAGPRAVALQDLDGDGRPEIVTANYESGNVSILRNLSQPGQINSSSFAAHLDLPVGSGAHGVAVVDLDGDQWADIVTVNAASDSLSLLRNLGTGQINPGAFSSAVTFGGPTYPHLVQAADLDADGRPDLLVTSYLGQTLTVYRNQAVPGVLTGGSFVALPSFGLAGRGHTVASGDLNGDGYPDVAVDTELSDSVGLFQNQKGGGVLASNLLGGRVDLGAGWNAWGNSIGDLDGDGRPDVIVANTYENTISIYQNLQPLAVSNQNQVVLINVDFGAGAEPSDKIGLAAAGQSASDFWNYYTRDDAVGNWRTFGAVVNLKTSSSVATGVGMTVANAPGAWGLGSPDKMYDDYIYPFDGGNVTITLTNLPAGNYELFAYAGDGNFELAVGGVSYGVKTTRDPAAASGPVWTEGIQYAKYTNVTVAAGQPLVLTVRPGLDGYAIISGLQLSAVVTTNPPAANCVALPGGAISWWRGESNAFDIVQVNHGVVVGGVTTVAGKVGSGFNFDGTGYLQVPHHPSLNCSNALTIELWYKSAQENNVYYGLIDKRVGPTGANYGINVAAGAGLGVYYDDANVQDGDDFGSSFEASRLVPAPSAGVFHHLAATYLQVSNNVIRLETYVDGQLVRTRFIAGSLANTLNTAPITIGATAQGAGEFFNGIIDEITLYNRVLSATEIQAIFAADAAGKCLPGSLAPAITQQPQDVLVVVGGTAQFNVTASGFPTPSYQWFFQSDLLPGQTNASLVLNQVLPDKQGAYHVQVSNPSGSLVSSNATLTVVSTQAVVLVDGGTAGFYNQALGTILDGTAPEFPLPLGQGDDPTIFPASEPGFFAAADILGSWLAAPPNLNSNWQALAVIPSSWDVNTETAIVYPIDAGAYGIADLRGDFDADNGIFVWVNGQFKFGAVAPGLPSPIGQYEYANIVLGALPPGSNYIQILREDNGVAAGSQIRITGTAMTTNRQPPTIVSQPASVAVDAGGSAQFEVVVAGTPAFSYQWRLGGADLIGATSSVLSFVNVQPVSGGDYTVVVTNLYGAITSSVATLTVLTYPPTITRQPTNVTAIESTSASFSVQATGTAPLSYQWLFQGQPLAGRTASSFTLSNLQLGNSGEYAAVVSNAYGVRTSSVAVLTVVPRPPCVSIHEGLVGWWRGENSQLDNWGDNTPTLSRAGNYTLGKVGLAFINSLIGIADAPALRMTNGLTIEGWVNPATVSSVRVIAAKYEYPLVPPYGTQSSYFLGLTNNGALFFMLSTNGSVLTNTMLATTNLLPINQWSHVAATYDGAVMRIYLNGNQIGQRNHAGGIFAGSAPLGLGGFAIGTSSPWQFSGSMDEISLYNRSLSAAEIQSIVAADLTGKCLAAPQLVQQPQSQNVQLGEDVKLTAVINGSRPITYQWYFNGLSTQFTTQRLVGATNAYLSVERFRSNNIGSYTLRVTNAAGFDISAPANLDALPAPACIDLASNIISWWPGNTNTLDAFGLNDIVNYSPVSYPTGKVTSGFAFNGSASRITVNNSTSLNFLSNANFSVEMWIRATNQVLSVQTYPNLPLLEKRTSSSTTWVGYSLSLNQGRLAFAMGAVLPTGLTVVSNYTSSGPDLRDAMFHHVAVTVNRSVTNGGVLYVDGLPVLTFNPRPLNLSLANTSPLYMGAPTATLSNSYFAGLIDEPAIYGRDLTATEIMAIRTAGASGRCRIAPSIINQPLSAIVTNGATTTLSVTATGTPLLRYQWRRNGGPLASGTNTTLVLSPTTGANIGAYSVVVSNAFGLVVSSNAIVSLNRAPIANADALATASNTAAVFPAAKLLLNDSDPDGDSLTVTSVTNGPGVTVSLVNGMVTYTPPNGFVGNQMFTYALTDSHGVSSVGTVMATVGIGGPAPINIVFGPSVAEGNFIVRFAGIPGLIYSIEAATSVQGPWTKVANATAPTTDQGFGIGVFEFREPVNGESARYYRTVYPSY